MRLSMSRRAWETIGVVALLGISTARATDAQYVLRGPGTLPLLAERRFGGGGEG